MASVSFQNATRTYPRSSAPAVDDLSLDIADGEFLVIVGPSGCGKTTSLRMLAGLESVDGGRIIIDGRDVTELEPHERNVAVVFQEYSLYPHMNVRDNMAFPLRVQGMPKHEIERRVQWAAQVLDLTPQLRRKPRVLSGGQRQRVAMGRAIVREPTVFLLDEPLSNLDETMRLETRAHISRMQRDVGVTTVYVTHNQGEALTMADRICVMRDGRIEQVGTPAEVYERPDNLFVATFLGVPAMNVITAPILAAGATVGGRELPLPSAALDALRRSQRTSVAIGFRPEDLRIVGADEGWPVRVALVEDQGVTYVTAQALFPGTEKDLAIRLDDRTRPRRGEVLHVQGNPDRMHLFDPETGDRLPA